MKIFDTANWVYETYSGTEEIMEALRCFEILKSKKISCVNAIGASRSMEKIEYVTGMRKVLMNSGIPFEDIVSGSYEAIDRTQMPCRIELCEPIVIVFEDHTTLEMMPGPDGLLRMSVCRCPEDVTEGMNHSNFDCRKLFQVLEGAVIKDVDVIICSQTRRIGSDEEYMNSTAVYYFETDDYGFYLEKGPWNSYAFGITERYGIEPDGYDHYRIPYSALVKCAKGNKQIYIQSGTENGGNICIVPIRHVRGSTEELFGIIRCDEESIAVDDGDLHSFMGCFLDKYFDKSYDYGESRDPYDRVEFDWNGYNIYTYDTVRRMLDEVEYCADMLESDFDAPVLAPIIKHFYYTDFIETFEEWDRQYTDKEKRMLIRENIDVAVSFYHRFVKRIRTMMERANSHDLIAFIGP